ncbi:MAG: tRNA 4-thiouridine(8) synthase ThiI [Patescibacteria group bacterium]|jgi:tRNA-specific 2-thiouridylase
MNKEKKQITALVLLSGGLDSLLAAKIIQDQGIDLIGVTFKSYFFDTSLPAQKQARELDISLRTLDISQEQLDKVLSPEHGYGVGLNPCLDCHLLMLKKAAALMANNRARFLVTGDVLGQRPLSQNKQALTIIDQEAGLEGLVVRPLSAKLLPATIPEKKGWLDRGKLFSLKGRSRKEQLRLVQNWGLKNYTTPAGGCLLTDKNFSKRLSKIIAVFPKSLSDSLGLASLGRHFWSDKTLIVIGRNHEENEEIKKTTQKGDCLIELKDIPGPTTLVRGEISDKVVEKAKKLTKEYAPKAKGKKVEFVIKN